MNKPGYTWRAPQNGDLEALTALNAACARVDGPNAAPVRSYQSLLSQPDATLYAASHLNSQGGQIVAVGWVRHSDKQVQIGGKVDPAHRRKGLGTALLRWSEEKANQNGKPVRIIIRNEALNEGSIALYARFGYTCDFVENWMRRDLSVALPVVATQFRYERWTSGAAPAFYRVYHFAFKERPNFPGYTAEEWIEDHMADEDFRPDFALLAYPADAVDHVGDNPSGDPAAGFITSAVVWVDTVDKPLRVGWIMQIGVLPEWRGRGVATDLLCEVMARFKAEGLGWADLHVNVNNPGAISLYEKLGFQTIGRRAKFSK